jgi:hypothetical protein
LVRALTDAGYSVVASDIERHPACILNGDMTTPVDFLWYRLSEFDCIVTNPPYSLKNDFITRCYELGKPFALLMPLYALESRTRQRLYHKHGLQVLVMDKRVNYETPSIKLRSSADFVSCWYCWGLPIPRPEIPRDILFVELPKP